MIRNPFALNTLFTLTALTICARPALAYTSSSAWSDWPTMEIAPDVYDLYGPDIADAILEASDAFNDVAADFAIWVEEGSTYPIYEEEDYATDGVNHIAVTYDIDAMCGSDACAYVWDDEGEIYEADIYFDWDLSTWSYGHDKDGMLAYNSSEPRLLQATLMHELGHVAGLNHEADVYNVMGQDWTHVYVSAGNAYAYLGEDASAGLAALYGSYSFQDLGVVHWKRSGSSGEYSTHTRTVLYSSTGSTLPTASGSSTTADCAPYYRVSRGSGVKTEFTFENNGASTQTTRANYYISTNNTITSSDTYLGWQGPTLSRDTPLIINTTLTIPSTLTRGRYYCLGVMVDALSTLSEINEANNTSWVGVYVN